MDQTRHIIELDDTVSKPRRFEFALLDNFTMLCFASADEALRIANRMAGQTLFEWRIVGEGGEAVTCSAGTTFQRDSDLDELNRDDTILVCGGIDVAQATTKRVLNWLRREARRSGERPEGGSLGEHAERALTGTPRPEEVGEELVVCPTFVIDGARIPTVTITARFGAARTAATDELQVELIYPADDVGRELFASLAPGR